MKFIIERDVQRWDVFFMQYDAMVFIDEHGNRFALSNESAVVLSFAEKYHIPYWELKASFDASRPVSISSAP